MIIPARPLLESFLLSPNLIKKEFYSSINFTKNGRTALEELALELKLITKFPEERASNIVKGGFSYSGQRCTAVKIVLACEDIADVLLEIMYLSLLLLVSHDTELLGQFEHCQDLKDINIPQKETEA